jgi:hypothetical protein
MWPQSVIFSVPKERYHPADWEDGGGYGPRGAGFRFAVTDGATLGYESRRWVRQLLGAFLAVGDAQTPPGPELDPQSLGWWLERAQQEWLRSVPPALDYIDQVKIKQGSFATFVGCQLDGLDGTSPPRWRAAVLGDAVLFHVRQGRLLKHLPALSVADFGTSPDGLFTLPERLAGMVNGFEFEDGDLAPGDVLFAATDAIAKWMLTWVEKDEEALWRPLEALADPGDFERMVAQQRQVKGMTGMKDDDVTLLRVRLQTKPLEELVMFR